MEVYGEKPKRFTKDWWDYIWTYYKWHFVSVLSAVCILVTMVQQCASRTEYDLQIMFVSEQKVSLNQTDLLAEYAKIMSIDATENDEIETYVLPLCIGDAEGMEAVNTTRSRITAELTMPRAYVFILPTDYGEVAAANGILEKTEVWAPELSEGGYLISLKDNEKLKEFGINTSYEELCIGVLKVSGKNKDNNIEKTRYENGVRFSRNILGLE